MTKNSIELFHRAILGNDISRTKLILEEAMKDPRFDIDEINEEGLTALQFSCFAGHLDIVKVLLSYKADIKKRDRDGNTLIHAAVLAGKGDVIKYLIRSGLKPIVRNDQNLMPIDVADDEIAIIVILLRAMLDHGYMDEIQEYMLEHPKLKRNIFEELERVKCRENEKNAILKELPYSSHVSPRRQAMNRDRALSEERQGRSISTFSKLSNSMQYLDCLTAPPPPPPSSRNDTNNNTNHQRNYRRNSGGEYYADAAPSLKRHNSSSSTSSHGSRSSRGSGAGAHYRHEQTTKNDYEARHRQTQQYLENRFGDNKSTGNRTNHRNYSDGYVSDSYDEKLSASMNGRLSRSSSISSHSSNHTGVFSDTCSNFDFPAQQPPQTQRRPLPPHPPHEDEAIYQNFQSVKPAGNLPTISESENIYENLPYKKKQSTQQQNAPPPLPPRDPNTQLQGHLHHNNKYEYEAVDSNYPPYISNNNKDRILMGSETDSGIDINETAGRVFALSLDEQQQNGYNGCYGDSNSSQNTELPSTQTSYSKPIGIYYSEQFNSTTVRRNGERAERPTSAHMNPKYRSWNGRTLLETQQHQNEPDNVAPYSSHGTRRQHLNQPQRHSLDDYDVYRSSQYEQNSGGMYRQAPPPPRRNTGELELRQFNFDHQPEIML